MTDITGAAAPPASPFPWTAQLGGLYAIWLREVKRAIRDRGQFIGGVSRPLLWVLILGIGLNPYFRGEVYGEVRFVVPYTYLQFVFPAVIALNIMYTSVQSAVSTIWDREFGFLREILVSPMGLSFVTKVAPRRMRGLMIGFWFSATGIGSYSAGWMAGYYKELPHHTFFMIVAAFPFFAALLTLPFLKRLNKFSK